MIGIPFPGGPEIERKASRFIQENGSEHLLDLPYAVHGTDMAFSGILGAAIAHAERERITDSFAIHCKKCLSRVVLR